MTFNFRPLIPQCTWKHWTFNIHGFDARWNDVPGLYIFSRQTANGWVPLYIGQATSLRDRLCRHEREAEARRLGATHVHAMVEKSALARNYAEAQLIGWFNPPLNAHFRTC